MSGPLLVPFGVTAVNAPHAPELPTVYIEKSEHFLSNSHSVSHLLLITIETLRYERDCLRNLSKDKIIEPLGIKKT